MDEELAHIQIKEYFESIRKETFEKALIKNKKELNQINLLKDLAEVLNNKKDFERFCNEFESLKKQNRYIRFGLVTIINNIKHTADLKLKLLTNA